MFNKPLTRRFSRRSILAGLGATAVLPILAACQPQVVEKVVEKPVEKVVTQIVEKVVEKEVIKKEIVEVEKAVVVKEEVIVAEKPVLPKYRDNITMRSLALRSEGDPWQDQADEFNASQNEIFVKALTGSPSGGWTEWLGTRFAAGNPPDLFFMSVSGLYANRAGELPLVVDVAPYMSPAQKEDAALGLESAVVYGKQTVWPCTIDTGESVNINTKVFDGVGVDWKKIQKDGWDYDEFRDVGKIVSEPEGQFMFGNALHWFFANCIENFGSAGIPLCSHAWGWYFGNKIGWEKPGFNEKLRMYQAMMMEDKSIPEMVLGLPEAASGHELFYNGEVVSTHGYSGQGAAMRDWNVKIDKGEVTGKKIDWEMAPLPIQHMKGHPATNILRANGLGLFQQKPFKGTEHTDNAGKFLQWLMKAERLKVECDFQNWLPPYASLRPGSKAMSDPLLRPWMEYTLENAACYFAVGHPMSMKIGLDLLVPMFGRILQGADVDSSLADVATEGQSLLDSWASKNPADAKLWADHPSNAWPACYYEPGSAAG